MICNKCGETCDSAFYKSGEQRRKRNLCKACSKRFTRERRWFLKIKAIQYKGGGCQKCNYDKCKAALEFHHRSDKIDTIGKMLSRLASWKRLKLELDKCDLLCSNCHKEYHHTDDGKFDFQFEHNVGE